VSKYSISDIAQICGVSKATVSRVINDKSDGVGENTKQRIQKVIKELNYRPNNLARSVTTSRSGIIGLIIPDVANLLYPTMIRGVSDFLTLHDYSMILCNSDNDPKKECAHLLSMVDKRVDGVILCSGISNEEFLAEYKEYNIPLVSIGRIFDNYLSEASIGGNNVKGALLAVRQLILTGNVRIAYIDGNSGVSGTSQRHDGYKKGLREAKIEYEDELVKFGEFSIDYGTGIVKEMLENGTKFTAIMTGSDLIAIGAIKALQEAGIKVPEDVEVIGFDDIELSRIFEPQLSTISKPHYDMATEATRMLLSIIEGTMGEMRHLTVEPKIVLRKTTKKVLD